jgi:hypothetical protein
MWRMRVAVDISDRGRKDSWEGFIKKHQTVCLATGIQGWPVYRGV